MCLLKILSSSLWHVFSFYGCFVVFCIHKQGHIQQTHSKHYSQQCKTERISLRSGIRQGYPLLLLLFNIVLDILAMQQKGKKVKGIQIRKEVNLSLFADDIENPKNVTRKLIKLFSEHNKVTGYKIYTQKSLAFLQTNMKIQKEKLRKQSHSSLQQKNKIPKNKPT